MTSSLAVGMKEEDSATVAQPLADLVTYVDACVEMDGEVLGEFVERNWNQVRDNTLGLMHLAKEMKRRFKLLDRKKQVDGNYLTIRGFKSFDKWVDSFTGISRRQFYYLLETEEKKNERNAERRASEKKKDEASATFIARCGDAKKKLAEIQRQIDAPFKDGEARDLKPLFNQIDPTCDAVFQEFLVLISPDGYEVCKGRGGWGVKKKKDEAEPEPPSPEDKRAKRSAAAKKAAATRAAKKARKATSLGECEHCGDGTLATEVINDSKYSKGDNVCAKCADSTRKYERKYLIRRMGVPKVMGKMCSLERLVTLGGKSMDMCNGDVRTYPTVADYIARVKEEFLGNSRYDQTVVLNHIARLEKKTEPSKALAAAGGGCPEDEAL